METYGYPIQLNDREFARFMFSIFAWQEIRDEYDWFVIFDLFTA